MKFKCILIFSLILVILSAGAVCAADGNVTSDDAMASDNSEIEIAAFENSTDILSGQTPYFEVDVPTVFHDLEGDEVIIYMDDDVKHNVEILVDGKREFKGILEDNCYYFDSLTYGKHTLKVNFLGDSKYNPASYSTTFYYSYLRVYYLGFNDYYDECHDYGQGLQIFFDFGDISMDGKVYVDDKLIYNGKFKGDSMIIPISDLTLGQHTYKITTSGKGKKFIAHTVEDVFTNEVHPIIEVPEMIVVSSDESIIYELPSDANGIFKVYFNGTDMNATMKNGKSRFSLKNMEIGHYECRLFYSNDSKYDEFYDYYPVDVIPDPNFNITPAAIVRQGIETELIFSSSQDIEGEIEVYGVDRFGDETAYSGYLKNGRATVPITVYKFGTNELKYKFGGYYSHVTGSFEIFANHKNPVIEADNFKTDYTSKKQFKVRIKDIDNKYVGEGKTVTFELYKGKKKIETKTALTDKDGYASVNFNHAPKSYKVKIKFGSASLTKKYKIKSILKTNKIFKKNKGTVAITVISNKIQIGATLKPVDGKYLKGKKIRFDFYKYSSEKNKFYKVKSYTLKTNSKGIAKKTFNKSPVKVSAYEMESGIVNEVKITYGQDSIYASYTLYQKSPFRYYFI